jgi:ribonuclease R
MTKRKKIKDPHAKREAENYTNPIPSREFILSYLDDLGEPASLLEIAEALKLEDEDSLEALRRRLIAMSRDGQLAKIRSGKYGPIDKLDLLRGRVAGHADGHGFLILEDRGKNDIFLPHKQMRKVFDGDTILAKIVRRDSRGKDEAVIIRVLERKHKEVVGRFFIEGGVGFVVPDNKRIPHDIVIPRQEQGAAEVGAVVTAEIISQPTMRTQAVGKIIEVLGAHMEPGMETEMAVRAHDIPHEWPDSVLDEAEKFPDEVTASEITDERKDLRHVPFVTIDGEDARDFDDAVFCEKKGKNDWTLYVAIADVSNYVKPHMQMNEEALNRGTSVYFPSRVIPMLPEKLSNGLCSLNPHVDRLVLVCQMTITKKGKMTDYQFYPAVIHSHARLTYTQVAAMLIDGDANLIADYEKIFPHLLEVYGLYEALAAYRKSEGAITFDSEEPQVVFDENKKIKSLKPLIRNEAHKLIEQCMLSANEAAAMYLEKHKWPGPFRVHPGPKQDKLPDLITFLNELGLGMSGGADPTPQDYARILDKVAERPDAHMIQTVLLRSLTQAFYGMENEGHFGLAFDAYTHFTSPIRRFPDLLVHRAIYAINRKQKMAKEDLPFLEKAVQHCSMAERRADDATRDVFGWLKCEFMVDKVGEEFNGVIAGVTGFGLFVEIEGIFVEGLIHITALSNDYYQFDSTRHKLTGEHSGVVYSIGDPMRIRVVRVDVDKRQIDFELATDGEPRKPMKKKKKPASKSKPKDGDKAKQKKKKKTTPKNKRKKKSEK